MSQQHDREEILEEELTSEAQAEADMFQQQEDEIREDEWKIAKLQDALTRTQADFDNFKKRTERDKGDMVFFLKNDIFKKILPRVDDLERMIKNTPDSEQSGALYQWVLTLHKTLVKDLEKLDVKAFDSLWEEVNPDKHEVMTQVPGEQGKIIDEFEKWYMLWERVLRVAKVVVWNGV